MKNTEQLLNCSDVLWKWMKAYHFIFVLNDNCNESDVFKSERCRTFNKLKQFLWLTDWKESYHS